MSSLAQEESRSISENITWGKRKQFSDGKVSLPYKQFLGYRRGADGLPEIDEEQAGIVRRIYRLFMEGKSVSYIAKVLTQEGIPTPGGKEVWQMAVIRSILTNEKYKGDALLQKRFTADFLTKRMKTNEGEVPQYYVRSSRPAIIDPTEWDRVQNELSRRQASRKRVICGSPFSGMLICGDCGEVYGSKVWHSNDPYRKVIWQCNGKFKGDRKCRTPHLSDEDIQSHFISAFSKLMTDRDELLDNCRLAQDTLTDCEEMEKESDDLLREMDVVAELAKKCVEENASAPIDQTEYMERYTKYSTRYDELKSRYDALQAKMAERKAKHTIIGSFMFEISELPTIPMEFNERLWNAVIDQVIVYEDERMVFSFMYGGDIEERL